MRRCVWLALACTSCVLDPDIVATLLPADAGPLRSVDASPSGDAGTLCLGADPSLLRIDSQGALSRSLEDGGVEEIATAECLADGTLSAALDNRGLTWAIAADGTVWVLTPGGACTPSPLSERLSSLTFVYRPDVGRELLYALQGGMVLAYDLALSNAPVVLRSTSARWLAGTRDGVLYAVDASMQTLVLSKVDLDTGDITTFHKVLHPEANDPSAITYWRDQFVVAFGSALYSFPVSDDRVSEFAPSAKLAIDALASSWCAK